MNGAFDVFHADAKGALPAGDQDDGRLGNIFEFVDLMLKLLRQILFDIDDGVVLRVFRQAAQRFARLLGIGDRAGLEAERLEAHDGLRTADNCNFKHKSHAAFPG